MKSCIFDIIENNKNATVNERSDFLVKRKNVNKIYGLKKKIIKYTKTNLIKLKTVILMFKVYLYIIIYA